MHSRLTFALCTAALLVTATCHAQDASTDISNRTLPSPHRPPSIQNGVQIQKPQVEDYVAVLDNLPLAASVKPKQPRRILVMAHSAGFYHTAIPLIAATVKAMGEKTGAYATDITYDAADVNTANLAKYDAIVLPDTTQFFLDDPNDAAATQARKDALISFVRSGKGFVALHAAGDSYHYPLAVGSPDLKPAWPEFNKMVGGFFKWHWNYPQGITVKLDDPKNPINKPLISAYGSEFSIHDEIYTFAPDSFSRKNVHVLTSIDYAKMSPADKALEPAATRRTDGDYALSWIHREGKGRVFYEALGHSEHIYAITPVMASVLAGIQYAIGDLPADDSPSQK